MNFDFRKILKSELERRSMANASYSLRAFARDLRVTPPQLSAVLSGKKGLSKERAKSIARALGLSRPESALFVASIVAEYGRSRIEKQLASKRIEKLMSASTPEFGEIQEARFQIISDWYHFAILQLAETKNFVWSFDYISRRLGIPIAVAEKAISALEKSGFISKKLSGYAKTDEFIKTEDVPSRAIRSHHQQVISKALLAIDEQTIQERDFSSVMVAVNKDQVPKLKEWIRSFREEFCAEAGKGLNRDEVYTMSIQFFRLSKNKPNKREDEI